VKDNEPWSDMRVAWDHFYSVGQYVRAEDLVIGNGLYKQLDLDKNDSLDNIEMEMLAEVEAHIVLVIELAAKDAAAPPEIKLAALRLPTEELNGIVQHQPNRITIGLPEMSLDIFANDRIGYEGYDQRALQIIQQGDADKNDYLSKDEFASVAGPLNLEYDAVDVDGNEMVFQDEIVMVLQQRNIINRNQIAVRADDQDDALLPSLDLNSDGRIDSREISQVADTLLSLDQNNDGQVQLHELRGSMMLGVVRGGGRGQIVQGDTTFAVPAVVRKPSDSTPRWFNGMDRNRDGGISWREFLGSRQQFDELDADADGFVIVEEATAK
jgi:Ca2+-binding EF-hand superfamily protein